MVHTLQPLRNEHHHLRPRLAVLRLAAEATDGPSRALLPDLLAQAIAFLTDEVLVHATAEEDVVYPAVERVLGRRATLTMSLDHLEIRRLADELVSLAATVDTEHLCPHDARELRRVLYGAYELIRLHLHKEDAAYLPILEAQLSEGEAAALLSTLGIAPATRRG